MALSMATVQEMLGILQMALHLLPNETDESGSLPERQPPGHEAA